ncbi:MAG: HAMP domain-containing histidine kinase [Acidimicrobiia bacterium]|nr:HAMP domain-containing histidine kinase [Acidimicrobiia bacterium]
MKKPSLWARMLTAQLLVIGLGAVTLLVLMELLAPSFFFNDVQRMNDMMVDPAMGDMMGNMMGSSSPGFLTPGVEAGLQDAFDSAFRRALAISLAVAGVGAMAVSGFATWRILSPLQAVSRNTRKLAEGAYDQRIDPPAEPELAALANDVNALADALESTEHRRIRLISEVAHELRTPLSTIEGYIEGLLDGVFQPTEEIYAASGREVRRLKRLADDLSELSRAEEGTQPLTLESTDLGALAGEVIGHLDTQARAKGIDLTVATPSTPIILDIDRDRITQVLTNIVGNALTYTDPGGRITVTVRTQARSAIVEVADTGRGLTPEQLSAVFERFYRADHTGPGGSGIGLTIARALTRRLGGDITAASPGPGKGSTFTVTLPLP